MLGATWAEIDIKARTWTVPAKRMKANKTHIVPLSDGAMAVLAGLGSDDHRPDTPLFTDDGKVLSDGRMLLLLRRMDESATVHGFRSSFRDWAGDETSFPREVIEFALAHGINDQTEEAYRRATAVKKRRALMQAWGGYVLDECRGDNVRQFPAGVTG